MDKDEEQEDLEIFLTCLEWEEKAIKDNQSNKKEKA
jgi:hypothetical protein